MQASRIERSVEVVEADSLLDAASTPPVPEMIGREIIAATSRSAAAAKFREYAERIESGDLDGARIQWRDGLHHLECVEVVHETESGSRAGRVQFLRFELMSPERPENPPEPHYTEKD